MSGRRGARSAKIPSAAHVHLPLPSFGGAHTRARFSRTTSKEHAHLTREERVPAPAKEEQGRKGESSSLTMTHMNGRRKFAVRIPVCRSCAPALALLRRRSHAHPLLPHKSALPRSRSAPSRIPRDASRRTSRERREEVREQEGGDEAPGDGREQRLGLPEGAEGARLVHAPEQAFPLRPCVRATDGCQRR